MATKAQKQLDARIQRLFGERCSNVQIPMLEILGIFRLARERAELSDEQLGDMIAGYVDAVRCDRATQGGAA